MFEYMVLIAGEWDNPDLVFADSPEEAARAFSRDRRPQPGAPLLVWGEREFSLLPELRPTPRVLPAE